MQLNKFSLKLKLTIKSAIPQIIPKIHFRLKISSFNFDNGHDTGNKQLRR